MGRCHGMIKHERSDLTTIKVSLFLECTAGSGFFFLVLLPKTTIQFFCNNQSRVARQAEWEKSFIPRAQSHGSKECCWDVSHGEQYNQHDIPHGGNATPVQHQ